MRHSDIALTMRTYTDERLLNAAGAVALLPDLPLGEPTHRDRAEADSLPAAGRRRRTVAPTVAPTTGGTGQSESISGKMGKVFRRDETGRDTKKPRETLVFAGFFEVEPKGVEPSTSALRTQRSPN